VPSSTDRYFLPARHSAVNPLAAAAAVVRWGRQTEGRPTVTQTLLLLLINTHTHPFNGSFSGTTWVSRYQKGKTSLDFTEARDSEWQWHPLGQMQVCTSLQTDNHASTQPISVFYRPDALPTAQPTASKH